VAVANVAIANALMRAANGLFIMFLPLAARLRTFGATPIGRHPLFLLRSRNPDGGSRTIGSAMSKEAASPALT
jgi:hypothetical protein